MTVTFNHTIVAAGDKNASTAFYQELFELPEARSWGLFINVLLGEGVLLQFAEPPVDIEMQHYAFLVDDELFVRCLAYIEERGIAYRADPQVKRPGETTGHGGRRVYFKGPAGYAIELITRPYLSSRD